MGHADFRRLVKRMRDAQKAYFRRRSSGLLDEAMRLEREVDRELECSGQGSLFTDEQTENPLRTDHDPEGRDQRSHH